MLIDSFTTQMYIDIFSNNFRISISVLILPIIYFFYRKVNPLIGALFIGFSGMIFRGILGLNMYGDFMSAVSADYHIFYFDLSYGLIYYFLLYKRKDYEITRWLLVVLIADLFSNIVEILFRIGINNIAEFSDKIYILLYVALFRTFIALMVVLVIQSYKMFLLKSEHNKRYQKLLLRVSELESELYFINRNMHQIETVMYNAYELYDTVENQGEEEIKTKALGIATDIHEIKKNYMNIYSGIREITEKDKEINKLKSFDLFSMLFNNLNRIASQKEVNLKYNVRHNFYVRDSYYFLSIIRNILVNSIESFEEYNISNKSITLYENSSDEFYIYKISDNGPGIKKTNIKNVFNPGYSTKFKENSGESNRGLGLYIVNEFVENIYKGKVKIESKIDIGTEITVYIPKAELEDI